MNVAAALALFTFTLNFTTAVSHFVVGRAPGWRSSRSFALVALTACFYSLGNLVFADATLPEWAYHAAIRSNYLTAHLHALAWTPLAFGRRDASFADLSPRLRRWLLFSASLAIVLAVTGWHVRPPFHELRVGWANVTYHYLSTTPVGDAYEVFILVALALPFVQFVRRLRAGERELEWTVVGFTVFLLCALVEALVASGVFVSLSPADLGFLAVVAPTSIQLARRFNADAHRLEALSADLASQVRERTEQLGQARSALMESERLAALGRLAAGVGHEINNPLTFMQLSLEQVDEHLAHEHAPADVRAALDHALEGTQRIQKVVEGLRTWSRRDGAFVPLDPHELARAALASAHEATAGVALLEPRFEEAPRVAGDAPRLVQALAHLLVNAAQAVAGQPGGGHVTVRVATGAEGECVFEIEDDGVGIPAGHRQRVIEPYFTTRASEGGLGLGLFVARGVVDAHGGHIRFEDAPGRGTRAIVSLPAVVPGALHAGLRVEMPRRPAPPSGSAPPSAATPPSASARARPRVLVVDDEPLVLQLVGRMLEPEWDVTCASGGLDALARIEREPFDAILCDLMMTGLSGIELAARVEARDPALRRRMVFLTGGAITPEAQAFVARPDVTHVLKPAASAELSRALGAACQLSRGGA